LYAGTNGGGVWSSSDGGGTWQSTGLSEAYVFALAADPVGGIFAGTNAGGVWASRDHGATWAVLETGIEDANISGYAVWIDPNNGQNLFVSFEGPLGLFGSQDGGASWRVTGEGFTGMASRGVAF